MTPVLVIDDEVQIRKLLRLYLEKNDFSVSEAGSCAEGMSQFTGIKPGIVLLDLGLPDGDGREMLQAIRERGDTPVIILSVRDAEAEIMELLDAGADDYLIKPFGIGELIARIRVALRHRTPKLMWEKPIKIGMIELHLDTREAFRDGEKQHLTPTEWSILEILVRNAGKIMTRNQILRAVWGPAMSEEYNNLRVYINQLRKIIEVEPSVPRVLLTEPGVGYRLIVEP
jgi:two-component system, OmpR family, KDP operon response regulator KdpE